MATQGAPPQHVSLPLNRILAHLGVKSVQIRLRAPRLNPLPFPVKGRPSTLRVLHSQEIWPDP